MELCTTKSRMKGSHAAWGRLRVGRGVWDSLSLPLHLAGNLTCSKRVFKKKKKKSHQLRWPYGERSSRRAPELPWPHALSAVGGGGGPGEPRSSAHVTGPPGRLHGFDKGTEHWTGRQSHRARRPWTYQ